MTATYDVANTNAGQYAMSYIEGSSALISWTTQHGCGGTDRNDPHNVNCNIVLQYLCDNTYTDSDPLYVKLSNGSNTGNLGTANDVTAAAITAARNGNDNDRRGRHESEGWYASCQNRPANQGLFNADQKLAQQTTQHTRQNNNGNRSGLECPSERDYYPFWAPSPWFDIAYLTSAYQDDNFDVCKMVSEGSMNNNKVSRCDPPTDKKKAAQVTPETCAAENGTWNSYTHGLAAPECRAAEWSRDNHLGNGRSGQMNNYTWTIPAFTELTTLETGPKAKVYASQYLKCVHRIRYNITTDDYDPWNTFAESNSVISNNPTVDIGADLQGLQLNINTAQFGRTFQDRSHIFTIRKRPTALPAGNIINLNIRGKRGNIVQTMPSVEYDFYPNQLTVKTSDLIHVQWTGSNTHNNGGDGGDGQAGDDGQGQTGTDRCNLVLTNAEGENWPIPLDLVDDHMWKNTKCYDFNGQLISDWVECALILASGGYYRNKASVATKTALDAQMNNGYASFIGGVFLKIEKPGTYYYICSRNNNFTNRSQKGVFVVTA